MATTNSSTKWAIALHGGAGVIQKDINSTRRVAYIEGLREALQTGVDALRRGRKNYSKSTVTEACVGEPAIRVVELATIVLEENILFNAGKGAVRNL
jgi:L-asparaginase / beta-aspartyl-peptidase